MNATQHDIKTFSISQLSTISNIDHEDLLLVSDYENGRCFTRKMDISQLFDRMTNDSILSNAVTDIRTCLGKAVQNAISSAIVSQVAKEVSSQMSADLTQKVLKIILDNHEDVCNRLDGNVEDGQYIIDCN